MYDVSKSFRDSMKMSAQFRRLYGTIGGVEFTQKNVLQGSFTISNQCSGGSDIQIGQVYVGELKATFRGLNIPRNSWKKKEIIPKQGLKLQDGTYEDVFLGHYFIDSAKWTKAGVAITAYDAMSKFDKNIHLTASSGTIYDYTIMACEACGVEFSLTKEEVAKFPNGSATLSVYEENDLETFRDLISWCAQTLAANAIISRDGKLIYKMYQDTPVESFNAYQRIDGTTISDFDSFYTGLSVVNIKDKTTTYYGAEVDNGLTMNLGSNPLLQYGTNEVLEKQRREILKAIQKINYTPTTIGLSTPMIFDLMDVIELTGGLVGDNKSIKTCITKFTWKYNGEYKIECTGSDPALASAKSKTDKNLSGLVTQIDASKTITYEFVNTQDIQISGDSDSPTKIISMAFTSKEKASVLFLAVALLEITPKVVDKEISGVIKYNQDTETSTSDLITEEVTKEVTFTYQEKTHPVVEVNYKLNDALIETFKPKQIYHEGNQILNLYYPLLSVPDDTTNKFEVFLKVTDGNISIKKANVLATVTGQGLVAEYYKWDGNIDIKEEIGKFALSSIGINKMTDSVQINQLAPTLKAITEQIDKLRFGSIFIKAMEDAFVPNEVYVQQTVEFNTNEYTEKVEDNIQLKTEYTYMGVEKEIDSGKMSITKVMTSDKASTEEINVEVIK